MTVYNTNASMAGGSGTGIYFWNGSKWSALSPVVPVTSIAISGDTVVGSHEILQFDYSVSPATASNQRIVWSSSNPNIATVTQAGTVCGIAAGLVTIMAYAQDGTAVNATKEIRVMSGIGLSELIDNNGYETYDYGAGLGVWMTENLRLSPDTLINGIGYYTYQNALTACPSPWMLPDSTQYAKLAEFVTARLWSDPAAPWFNQFSGRINASDNNLSLGHDNRLWQSSSMREIWFNRGKLVGFSNMVSVPGSRAAIRCRRD
jgi:hypothetical protein